MIATQNLLRHCPKCGSVRVFESRQRGPIERVIAAMGGEIRRCHDCCARKAWFGVSPFPVGNRDPEGPVWGGFLMIGSGGALVALVVWMVARFAERSS